MAASICPRCTLRIGTSAFRTSSKTARVPLSRPFSSTPGTSADNRITTTTQATTTSNPQRSPPQATSTSAAHPFSTPNTPSPSKSLKSDPKAGPSIKSAHNSQSAAPAIVSSVSAGTTLKGLNYFKGKEDPKAMADEEYPPWLWTILGSPKKSDVLGAAKEETDPRIYSKSAKARQLANRRVREKEAEKAQFGKAHEIPVYEQTVDLPDSGEEGDGARHGLQRAMRHKRRADIKTKNFLQGMR